MPLDVHLVSDLQKSAMPPGSPICAWIQTPTLIFHPVGEVQPNWTVENVSRRGAFTIPSGPHSGHRRGLRHAGRQAHRHAAAERQDAFRRRAWMCRRTGAHSGISGARSPLRIQPRRSPHRFRRRSAGGRSLHVLRGAHRSQESSVRRRRTAPGRAGVFPGGARFATAGCGIPAGSAAAGRCGQLRTFQVRVRRAERSGLDALGFEESLQKLREPRRLAIRSSRTGVGGGVCPRAGAG